MRIDTHQHFWRYEPGRDSWITDQMGILKRDYLPKDLQSELSNAGIDGCIAVQTSQSEEETRFLLELAAVHEFIVGVVGWADLRDPGIDERLAGWREFPKLRGFRHIVQSEPDDQFMLQADFRRGIAALSRFGFVYDILIYPRQLPAAIELAAAHPAQAFVLDHLAKPDVRSGQTKEWERNFRELASSPNVCCKLSGLITEADWNSWRHENFRPYLDAAFEAFGSERLMFGSDWPVCLLAGSYQEVVGLIASYVCDLPAAEQAAVFGANAARCYGLRVAQG